jgi:hypothetical protein
MTTYRNTKKDKINKQMKMVLGVIILPTFQICPPKLALINRATA